MKGPETCPEEGIAPWGRTDERACASSPAQMWSGGKQALGVSGPGVLALTVKG